MTELPQLWERWALILSGAEMARRDLPKLHTHRGKGNVPQQAALEAEISAEPKPEQITGVTLGILFQLVF